MPYLSRHGTMKPPLGVRVNPAHPLAQGLICAFLFQQDSTIIATDAAWPITYALRGPAVSADGALGLATARTPTYATHENSTHPPSWASNSAGSALSLHEECFLRLRDALGTSNQSRWLPTGDCTICIIRRKTDMTNRAGTLFGVDSGASASARCGAYVPYSDGTVYWDYGFNGYAAPNRLTVSGLSFSTTVPERWVFTAGSRGSAIWQNGTKVASQTTAITRAQSDTSCFYLNLGNGFSLGDRQDFNYFAAYNVQWSDDLCRWWSAEPYDHLWGSPMTYPGPSSSALLGATAGESSVVTPSGKRSGFGAQKPSRRLRGRRV